MRRLPFLLSLVLFACRSPAEPVGVPGLDFESRIVAGIPTLATDAVGGEGLIVVTGVIHTVGTGFTLTGKLTSTGANALSLEIDVQDNAPGQPFPVQNFYRATLRLLPPGDYDLSVNHSIHDPAPGSRLRVFHRIVHVK